MKNTESRIRIVYQGECSKLTARGKGSLSYELGVNESKEQFIRIAGNSQGGTFSVEWISIKSVAIMLETPDPANPILTATLLKKLFIGRSANNHGYLAATLRQENVIAQQASQLTNLSFKEMKAKIKSLHDIDLPDHIAASLKEKKAAAMKPPETAGKKGRPKTTSR